VDGFRDQLAPDGKPVNIVSLSNDNGLQAVFMDWGATWLSCCVPVRNESGDSRHQREVLLRSPTFTDHLRQRAYFGATVGRYANRIADGAFLLPGRVSGRHSGRRVQLKTNEAGNTLHGGPRGFDATRWQIETRSEKHVVFQLYSVDDDQGFPGNLSVRASYEIGADNSIIARYEATTDKTCPVNLTNHAYFNLAETHDTILQHSLRISADYYLPVRESGIPEKGLKSVSGTSFDFRTAKTVGRDLLTDADQRKVSGYDHGFLLTEETRESALPAVTLISPDALLRLDILTGKPALQFYSGNYLEGTPGADGRPYSIHAGLALESEFLPDAPNHAEWPHDSSFLLPGELYRYQTTFRFTS
jgi:aldose 1-epimerase